MPFPSPADIPEPGIEPGSPELQADSVPLSHHGSPTQHTLQENHNSKRHLDPVFIAGLCTTAMIGKQPRCPSTDECVKKLWCIYTMEYYSDIKKNNFEAVVLRWMNLQPVTQCKVKSEKKKYCILMHK